MTDLRFDGRVALVTGGGRGIGRAHVELLASRGCKVVVADAAFDPAGKRQDCDPAADLVSEIAARGGTAVAFRGDVVTDAEAMVASAMEAFGALDIVINNAGVLGTFSKFSEADPKAWDRVTDIHYRGTVAVCRAAWPHLAASDTGRIVNTASIAILGEELQSDYGSAKSAIFGLSRSLALEGRHEGITVNCILPSGYTRMMETIADDEVRLLMKTWMLPEHVAAFVGWLVHPSTTVTGEAFNVGGGRAERFVLAAGPSMKVKESTPEAWAQEYAGLFNEDRLVKQGNMLEHFAAELRDIDPSKASLIDTYLATGLENVESS